MAAEPLRPARAGALRRALDFLCDYRYPIALVLFVALVCLRVSGSSIGLYSRIFTDGSSGSGVVLGVDRSIRSDEWLVQTPFYLAQAKAGFPLVNRNLSENGQNMILSYNAPVRDISVLAKPFNWGFLLFGADVGLSWYWSLKLLLLFLLSYEMCVILTGNFRPLCALGAFWITFSPACQWWFMQHVGDLLFYMQAMVVAFYYYLRFRDRLLPRALLAAGFALAASGFALVLYPALQVPLAYLTLLFLVLIALDYREAAPANAPEGLRRRPRLPLADLLIAAGALALCAGILLHVFLISKDAIFTTLNTVYPGRRVSTGGTEKFYDLSQFLSNVLLPYRAIGYRNACEVSGFFNFLPAALAALVLLLRRRERRSLRYGIALSAYAVLSAGYMLFRIPEALAKATLLSYVPANRMGLACGLASMYLTIWLGGVLIRRGGLGRRASLAVCAGATVFYAVSIAASPIWRYLGLYVLAVLFVLLAVLLFLFLRGRVLPFAVLMLALILVSGAPVNPIATGTGAVYDNTLSAAVTRLQKTDAHAVWASGDMLSGALLEADGVKTLSGTNFTPDLRQWAKLDPSGRYAGVYNRYAHISFRPTRGKTTFLLIAPDQFQVNLAFADMRRLGITYYLSRGVTVPREAGGVRMTPVYPRDRDGYTIYRVTGA